MIATKANIQANRTSTKQNPNVPFLYRTRTFSGAKNNPTPEGKKPKNVSPIVECEKCCSLYDVKMVRIHSGRGWGAGFKGWSGKIPMCKNCRKKRYGEWKYAD